MSTVNELLKLAKIELNELNIGEIFYIRDLFKGYEWNRIPRSDRLLIGTLFLNYVKSEDTLINPHDKAASGQQRYVKEARDE